MENTFGEAPAASNFHFFALPLCPCHSQKDHAWSQFLNPACTIRRISKSLHRKGQIPLGFSRSVLPELIMAGDEEIQTLSSSTAKLGLLPTNVNGDSTLMVRDLPRIPGITAPLTSISSIILPTSSKASQRSRVGSMDISSPNLLSLPFEIRLMIFGLLIPRGRDFLLRWLCLGLESCAFCDHRFSPVKDVATALFRVSATCHREIASLLYGQNLFTFDTIQEADRWFDRIGAGNASFIRSIQLHCREKGRRRLGLFKLSIKHFDDVLPKLSSIQELRIAGLGGRTGYWTNGDLHRARAAIAHVPHLAKTFHSRTDNCTLRLSTEEGKAEAGVRSLY